MSAIYFDARIDGAQLARDIDQINKNLARITNSVKKEGDEIDDLARRMGASLAGAFSLFAAGGFIKDIARVRGEFQQLEVAFETMLNSKEKADKLMAEVVDFAATTPFELQQVAGGTKQLLAYGVAAEDIIPTLKSLGDVSAGLSVPMERLILNYGQVRTQLKLTGRELRDFQVAGVPIVAELSKNLGVAESKVADMVSAGQIGFKDVEKAFRSMTGEGGRFNDLMDKQAKTITGLASNFADAWNKMMNSIGEENEGIIAGSIKGAMVVVENYEKVLDILKILVVTYGTYKAAVIATAVAKKSEMWIDSIRLIAMYRKEMGLATAAQQAFNTAAKANPYGLIIAGIAGVVTLLTVFAGQTKKTEDYINDLNDAIESIGKQSSVDQLISDYSNLQGKTNKTKEEQAKLNTTIAELSKIFPDAIRGIDEYGNTLGLNKDKVIELNEQLRENARIVTEQSVSEAQEEQNKLIAERKKLLDEVNKGYVTSTVQYQGAAPQQIDVQLEKEGIEWRRKKIEELGKEIGKLGGTIGNTQDKLNQFGSVDKENFKRQYAELFGDVANMTTSQAEETKNQLEKLLQYQFGTEITETIKSQINVLNKQLALPTIQEQIEKTTQQLAKAKKTLDAMRTPGSQSDATKIEGQESTVKELEETLAKLTGTSKKDAAKRAADEKERQKKALESLMEFNDQQLSLERQLQASRIAIMKQGAERQQAEAELDYQTQIDIIKRQQDEYLKVFNAKQGFEPGDKGYISKLPAEELAKFDQLRVDAEQQKNLKIEQINKEAADKVKAIWSEVNDVFLTDTDASLKEIDKYYDDLAKSLKEKDPGADLSDIEKARQYAKTQVVTDAEMQRFNFEEQIEMQRAEMSTQGFNRELRIEQKKLEIAKKYAQLKINSLTKADATKNKQEIEALKEFVKATDEGLKGINKNQSKISETADTYAEELRLVHEITAELLQQFGVNQANAKIINDVLNAILSGNTIQMIGAAVRTIITLFPQTAAEKYANQINRINQALREQQALIDQAKREGSEAQRRKEEILLLKQKLAADEQALIEAEKKKENALGWGDAYEEKKQKVKDLTAAVVEDKLAIEQAEQALNDFLTGGVTQNTIAGVIAEGFQAGKTSVDDFAQYMNDVLLNAVMQIFKAEILGPQIDALSQYTLSALSDKKLTEAEKAEIDRQTKEIANINKQLWDDLTGALKLPEGEKGTDRTGLTGAIKGITEETAGLIAGQFFAMREVNQKQYMTGLEQLDGINQSVTHLAKIEINTRPIARLNEVVELTRETNSILKERL